MGKINPRVLVLFVIVLGIAASSRAEVSLDDVIAAQRTYLARIETLDMTYANEQTTLIKMPDRPAGWSFRFVSRVRISGNMYRLDSRLDDSVNPPREATEGEISTFDLKEHQVFDKSSLLLQVHLKLTAGDFNENVPVFEPFEMVIPAVYERTFEALQSADAWKKFGASYKMDEPAEFAGHSCWTASLYKNNVRERRWFLAKDLGIYPIGFEDYHPTGELAGRYVVQEVKSVQTEKGPVNVPMKATDVWYMPTGTPTWYYSFEVRPDLLTVNQPIDIKLFTIDKSLAREFRNRDNPANNYTLGPEEIPTNPAADDASQKSPTTSIAGESAPAPVAAVWSGAEWTVLIASLAALLIGLLCIAIWPRRRSISGT